MILKKMGQYFHFEHENGEVNKKGLMCNRGLYWFSNLHKYSVATIRDIFEEVVDLNDWPQGTIWAVGDNGDVVVFNSLDKTVVIEDANSSDDNF